MIRILLVGVSFIRSFVFHPVRTVIIFAVLAGLWWYSDKADARNYGFPEPVPGVATSVFPHITPADSPPVHHNLKRPAVRRHVNHGPA